ncbi:MAG TPA: hypothetical protein VN957_28185, partial [Chthoniobacterales bacterium]|nr:hypothetical protein [Chthoniobacterales bacterium]
GMAAKLLRVVFLAPVIAILPWILRSRSGDGARGQTESGPKPQFLPWYVGGFLRRTSGHRIYSARIQRVSDRAPNSV